MQHMKSCIVVFYSHLRLFMPKTAAGLKSRTSINSDCLDDIVIMFVR